MNHLAVTSFSPRGWITYGQRFVDSFLTHWDIPLLVYAEGQNRPLNHERLVWMDLECDRDRKEFMQRYGGREFNDPRDFNRMSVKFSQKIWAITSRDLYSRWRLWIDADVVWDHPVTRDDLATLCPEDCSLSYLGRSGMMRPNQPLYTETGFVAYRTADPRVVAMLADMRRVYTTGELFQHGPHDWHDAATFDLCRRRSGIPDDQQHNLSPNAKRLDAWPQSPLAKFGRHQKGLHSKKQEYGGTA